jgi:hypothetical protein
MASPFNFGTPAASSGAARRQGACLGRARSGRGCDRRAFPRARERKRCCPRRPTTQALLVLRAPRACPGASRVLAFPAGGFSFGAGSAPGFGFGAATGSGEASRLGARAAAPGSGRAGSERPHKAQQRPPRSDCVLFPPAPSASPFLAATAAPASTPAFGAAPAAAPAPASAPAFGFGAPSSGGGFGFGAAGAAARGPLGSADPTSWHGTLLQQ